MAGIPKNFDAISNVLPTYNFIDIAAGTGYINFYAGTTVDLNLLSNYTFYSNTLYTTAAVAAGAAAKVIDLDFDTVLNRPMDIRGLGIVNVPVAIGASGGGATTQMYIIAILRKWDGAVETDIVTNQSSTFSVTATGAPTYKTLAIDLNIPLTHFKIGETLRLTLEVWGTTTIAPKSVYIAYDPMSRTSDGTLSWDASGAVPSKTVFLLPVRLNL